MVKTLPSSAGGVGSIPGGGAKIPHASRPKHQNIKHSNIVTNSIKTLKMVHIKKKIFKTKEIFFLMEFLFYYKDFLLFLKIFYWGIVALQCCVSFCYSRE